MFANILNEAPVLLNSFYQALAAFIIRNIASICIQVRSIHRNEVANEDLLLILVSSYQGHILSDKGMLTHMCVDFAELNAEATNLNLVICTSCALHNAIRQVSPEVSRAIHAIADALPIPRLHTSEATLWVQNCVFPRGRVAREPVVDELLCAGILVEVAFSQTTGADVDLADLAYGTWDVSVVPVDNE
jgi:hypothetical protein